MIRIKIPYIGAIFIVSLISFATIFIDHASFHYYNAFNIKTLFMNIFMLQDYPFFLFLDKFMGTNIAITSFASARPFWTLAIEWWYYIFFGFIFFYLKDKIKVKVSDILILAFFSIVPLYNLLGGNGNGLTLIWIGGIIIENLYEDIKIESQTLMKIIVFALSVLLIADGIYEKNAYSRNFQVLVLLWLFLILNTLKDKNYDMSKYKLCRVIKLLSSQSYSLYLLHYSILDFIVCIPDWHISNGIKMAIGIIISNITAYFFAQIFENKSSYIVKKCKYHLDRFL